MTGTERRVLSGAPGAGPPTRLGAVYRLLFNLVFRRIDPERAHTLVFATIRTVADVPGLRTLVARVLGAPAGGEVQLWGRRFGSRMGLAAGFDKDGYAISSSVSTSDM